MGRFSERRALYYEDDDSFNPVLTFDVNEYLINNYVATSLKQRRAVWHLCQSDDNFDFSSIEDQIDEWVLKYADSDPVMNLEKKEPAELYDSVDDEDLDDEDLDDEFEEEDLEEVEEIVTDLASVNIRTYLETKFLDIPDEEADDLIYIIQSHISYDDIYSQFSLMIDEFYNGNYDEFLEDADSDKDEPTSTENGTMNE